MEDLQSVKLELDRLKTNLTAAEMRRDEVMAGLHSTYGLKTAKAAVAERKKLLEQTIPTMEKKRDGFIAKAQEVLNGLNTGPDTGGRPAEQAGPAGQNQPGGLPQGRTPVGRKR